MYTIKLVRLLKLLKDNNIDILGKIKSPFIPEKGEVLNYKGKDYRISNMSYAVNEEDILEIVLYLY